MICQFCEIEYPADAARCAECGAELVEALPPASDEIVLEPLAEIFRRRELELLVEELEAARIPYSVHSGTAWAMQGSQTLASVARRSAWEAQVLVVSTRREEAEAALEAAKEALKLEPEEVDEDLDEDEDFDDELEEAGELGPDDGGEIRPH